MKAKKFEKFKKKISELNIKQLREVDKITSRLFIDLIRKTLDETKGRAFNDG